MLSIVSQQNAQWLRIRSWYDPITTLGLVLCYSRYVMIAHSLIIQYLNDVMLSIVSQQNAQW
jgi:hypothetical protein